MVRLKDVLIEDLEEQIVQLRFKRKFERGFLSGEFRDMRQFFMNQVSHGLNLIERGTAELQSLLERSLVYLVACIPDVPVQLDENGEEQPSQLKKGLKECL